MARTPRRPTKPSKGKAAVAAKPPGLPWRITKIRLWREKAGLTQQEVADKLVELDPDLDYTRTSIQRIEHGLQKPQVIVLEAMARMFGAPNLSAMLDQTPEEAE